MERLVFMADAMLVASQIILSFHRTPEGSSNELLANLWMYRNRLSTVPHDKIYGSLGLLRNKSINITPDYQRTFEEVCQSAVLEDIRVSDNLHALRGTRVEINEDTPSWTTNWNDFDYWAEDRARILTDLYSKTYAASKSLGAKVRTETMSRSPFQILQVQGKVINSVQHIFPYSYTATSHLSSLFTGAQTVRLISKSQDYVGGGSIANAIWRTMIGDCILPAYESQDLFHNANKSTTQQFKPSLRRARPSDFLPFLLGFFSAAPNEYLARILPPQFTNQEQLRKRKGRLQNCSAVSNIYASCERARSGRQMFITSGGYIGLGPQSLKCGDGVAILSGGSTPFVLRESIFSGQGTTKSRWRIVGDCYVHGWMDGEMVTDENVEEWSMLDII